MIGNGEHDSFKLFQIVAHQVAGESEMIAIVVRAKNHKRAFVAKQSIIVKNWEKNLRSSYL